MTVQEFQNLSLKTISQLTEKPISNWSRWLNGRSMSHQALIESAQKLYMSSDELARAIELRQKETAA
jgi:hypothetical protein